MKMHRVRYNRGKLYYNGTDKFPLLTLDTKTKEHADPF